VGRASEFTREWAADRDPLHPSRRSISVLARVDDCALASEQVASREAVFPLHPIECDDGLVVEIAARGTLDLRERRALRELAGELRESMSASERVVLSRQTLSEFVCDRRYGWAEECEQQFGRAPGVICHEWNTAAHASEYEGRPGRRPLTAAELQRFFDHADAQVDRVAGSGRKGTLAAFRDAALFKVVYAWGLRRLEVVMLDVRICIATRTPRSSAPTGRCTFGMGRRRAGARRSAERCCRCMIGRWTRSGSTSRRSVASLTRPVIPRCG
jgi:hypothetical protein